MFDQRVDHCLGILAANLHQPDLAHLPLDQGCNLAIRAPEKQVAFPVARNGPVFQRGRTLADRYGVPNFAGIACFLGVVPRAARVRHKCANSSFFLCNLDW